MTGGRTETIHIVGIGSITEAREVVRRSFDVAEFTPQNPTRWDEACGRFSRLVG